MKLKLIRLYDQGCDRNLYNNILWKVMVAFLFLIAAYHPSKAEAGTVVTPAAISVAVDYLEETATVTAGSNTKVYVSKDNKNWELMSSNVLDISAMLQTREVTLYFKGNKDTTPTNIKLSGEDASLKAAYAVFDGGGRVSFSGTNLPIEVRKGANGQWKLIQNPNNYYVTTQYETYGASLYFRVIGTATRRPGKIVSVKVPKRPTAPSMKLDGGKLNISGFKPGETQYRVGDSTAWILFPTSSTLRTMDLKDLLGQETNTNTIKGGTIEFRTIYNDSKKKVASSVKVIEVPAQPGAPENVTLTGTTLTAVDANKRKYYEYTIVQGTGTLDLKTAKWTSFTSAKPIIIKAAAVGDKIHVRAKSYTDSITKQVVPASISKENTVQTITRILK